MTRRLAEAAARAEAELRRARAADDRARAAVRDAAKRRQRAYRLRRAATSDADQ